MRSFRGYPFKRPSKKRRGVKNCKCKVKFKAALHKNCCNLPKFVVSRLVHKNLFSWIFCILRALLHKNCCNLFKFVATSGRLVTEQTMPHRNGDATTKGKVTWKCVAKFQPHIGNILSISSEQGNTLSVKKYQMHTFSRRHHTKVHLVNRWMNQENLNETVVCPSKRVMSGCKNIKCECIFRRKINECFALNRG